jgi:hypothetical protein
MYTAISNQRGQQIVDLINSHRSSLKTFGDRSIPQAMGDEMTIREIIITTNDVLTTDYNPANAYIHGYFLDDATKNDLYPNIYLPENLGILRKAGATALGSAAFVIESGGRLNILAGEFATRFKAKVKTADIDPDASGTVTIWWKHIDDDDIVSSGHDVQAINRLTNTVGKNGFVEIEWNSSEYAWYIVGVSDPISIIDFELKTNLTQGETAQAWPIQFDAGAAVIPRTAGTDVTVRDPHSQFRGVGHDVRTAGGSRGKAQWIEDEEQSGFQIIEMQGPAMIISGVAPSTGTSANKASYSFTLGSPQIIQPIDATYIIGLEGGTGDLTVYKDTNWGFAHGAPVVAEWSKKNSRYECRPDFMNYKVRYDSTGKKFQQSYDGQQTWEDITGFTGGADLSQLRIEYSTSTHVLRFSVDGGTTWTTIDAAVDKCSG